MIDTKKEKKTYYNLQLIMVTLIESKSQKLSSLQNLQKVKAKKGLQEISIKSKNK